MKASFQHRDNGTSVQCLEVPYASRQLGVEVPGCSCRACDARCSIRGQADGWRATTRGSSSTHCHPAHDGTSDCSKMRAVVPILLLVALAGLESVLSASLEVAGMQNVSDDTVELNELHKTETLQSDEETESEEEESQEEVNFLEASKDKDPEEIKRQDETVVTYLMHKEKTDDEENATEKEESEEQAEAADPKQEAFKEAVDEESEDSEESDSLRPKREHHVEEVKNMAPNPPECGTVFYRPSPASDSDPEDMIEEEKEHGNAPLV